MRREPWGSSPFDRPDPALFSPGDQLLGYGVAATGIAGGLVWATGQAAGLAFGHTWLHVDPAELAGVLVHLREHLGDPQLAWPADAQRALPGPVGMYATFTATAAAAGTAAGQVVRLVGAGDRPRLGRPGRATRERSSTWARRSELRGLLVRHPQPGRLVLGRTGGLTSRLLAAEDCHSVLVYGPPGSHKTVGAVIPAMLEWDGPVVSTSVKPDVLHATLAERRAMGQVWVYDPLGVTGERSARWTPLASCRTWHGALTTAYFLAQAADLGTGAATSAEHQYWTRAGPAACWAAHRGGRGRRPTVTADRTGTGRLGNLVLPSGVEVGWQQDAACKDTPDPDVFFPGKGEDAEAAKRICAGCPVLGECLAFALATMRAADRDHGVYGGLTPAERARLRGGPVLVRAHRLDSRAQAVIGRRLARQVGVAAAARALRVTEEALTDAWQRRRLLSPAARRPARQAGERLYGDRVMAEQALALASQLGVRRAAAALGVTHGVLYRAWQHHGLDRPAHQPRQRSAGLLRAAAGPPAGMPRRSRGGDGREEVGDRDRR